MRDAQTMIATGQANLTSGAYEVAPHRQSHSARMHPTAPRAFRPCTPHRRARRALCVPQVKAGLATTDKVEQLCVCLNDLFPSASRLYHPSLAIAILLVVLLALNNALCCMLGCCKNSAPAPPGPKESSPLLTP